MSPFTIFVLIFILIAAVWGWMSGFMAQIGKFGGLILGIAICRICGPSVVAAVCGTTNVGADNMLYVILIYVLLFIAVYFLVTMLLRMLRGVIAKVHLGVLDSLAGAVLKVMLWLLLLSLAMNLFVVIVPSTPLTADPTFARILWFGPYLLGTESAAKIGEFVTNAIGA